MWGGAPTFPWLEARINRMTENQGRVLVTGAAGYIGSVLVRQLLNDGEEVVGLDSLRFGGESLLGVLDEPEFELVVGDLRDPDAVGRSLAGVDRVVHLAAIVGDPACAKMQDEAEEINWVATKSLYDRCRDSDCVRRFVFGSTCSNYGKMEWETFVNEDSELRPVSLYARLKVRMEEYVLAGPTSNGMIGTSLRFATAYGLSPRPRFDLTVNEFTREVVLGRTLEIFGKQFWRPYCHIHDLSRACRLVLSQPGSKVASKVFGVGSTAENYQKAMLADLLTARFPDADIQYVHRDEDPRDYRVDFSKIENELDFSVTRTVPDGIDEYAHAIKTGVIQEPDSSRYRNS
jgi:nucleoside-diphosphate-sugar epimerase